MRCTDYDVYTYAVRAAELSELILGCVSDACVDDPCLNGGTCTDGGGNIKCLCLPTYGGDFCQTGKLSAAESTSLLNMLGSWWKLIII